MGLLGISDPPREGVVDDIAACEAAGIKTVMITGDNLTTAKTIARRIGILKDDTLAIAGAELHEMTDEERTSTIAWETRQLEIMDWLTDDVDWITGEKHDAIALVCKQ